MRRKIPSSSSLQAFEAAARHGNFARAAEELSLTEGAISRQIGRLESLLNCKLFDRVGSRVKLNAVGQNYAHHVRETLDRLDRNTQYIQGLPEGTKSLEISVLPTFASRWLIPRLGDFQKKYPDIMLNITVRTDPFILTGSGFDAAIHFENSAWAGMHTQNLLEEHLIPVCHPMLLVDSELKEQLLELPRIHRHQNPEAWEEYAREYGISFKYPAQGVRYDLHEMAISAALAGLGIALVPSIYVENELKNGLLIAPWPESKILKKQFCLVKPLEKGINNTTLVIFEKWLKTEAIK
ncbi:LysR substrate-binding domain-containing protein (plasmid) [Acinetobacter sp. ESL0695]|uniref:LysR substrate-binding domain-containing protein n=1 Tax=Acinetobacter sp. ESL0695 TaxID=2983215 RepID=UPI0023F4DB23|nr:LysR substrate-binding domain-containing protein [Acinetobacter sp. ESL0695]WEV50202.1 LysR substrate-binding domain-containing protein [Acinetobacter sp. ESL0695]